MVSVAAAGPATNLVLATLAALLIHAVALLPPDFGRWFFANLAHSIELNVILALFNLIPIPPLDGGRVAVGLLPDFLAVPLARLGRYGISIVIGVLFSLPLLAAQAGYRLNLFTRLIGRPASALIDAILVLTGNR